MNSAVDDIKSRINIVDLVGEYVKLQKAGANWKACCPFHNEKSPSFMVNEEKQIFHCFGCGKGGDMFTFLMEIESLEFREALKILAEKSGVQLENFNPEAQKGKNRVLEALEWATKFWEKQLWEGSGKDKILKYLSERGLTSDSIRQFRIGYAPEGWNNLFNFLLQKGFAVEDILGAGLIIDKEIGANRYYDRFRDRIMFPIEDAMGKVIGFSARVAPGGDESQAKYINTPETTVYHKSKVLYGISKAKQAIKEKDFVLLVEGNMDVIAAHQAGLRNTVAASGTALTVEQLAILRRYTNSKNIKMLFDMDSAGQNAAKKSLELYLLNFFGSGIIPSVVFLENGKDAADAVKDDPASLLRAVENSQSALDYFWRQLLKKYDQKNPQQKNQIIQEWTEIVSHIPNDSPINSAEKVAWSKKLAHEMEVEEKLILDVVKRQSSTKSPKKDDFERTEEVLRFAKKTDLLLDKIAGLLLTDQQLWRDASEREDVRRIASENRFLNLIVSQGSKVNFSLSNLVSRVDRSAGERLEKMSLEAGFNFDHGQISEIDKQEVRRNLETYLSNYQKELQKEKLRVIIKDIKKAEESGDRESLKVLMEEFSRMSQEVK